MVVSVMNADGAGARKWWALAGLTLGVLAVGLDATVLSVALPTLAGSLHASATDLQWFVSAYTLALAVGLLPGGLLGDRYGRKKVMMITLAVASFAQLLATQLRDVTGGEDGGALGGEDGGEPCGKDGWTRSRSDSSGRPGAENPVGVVAATGLTLLPAPRTNDGRSGSRLTG